MRSEFEGVQRIYPYSKDGFIDIFKVDYYGIKIHLYNSFCYFALLKEDRDWQLIVFEDYDYFIEWREKNPKVEIIFQEGKNDNNTKNM